MGEQRTNGGSPADDPDLQAHLRANTPPHAVRPWPLPTASSPRVERLHADVRSSRDRRERDRAVEEFLAEIRDAGSPLVEPSDPGWELFTFTWRGTAPHGVTLHLNGVTDRIDIADTLLRHLVGTSFHTLTVRMPEAWLASYLLVSLPATPRVILHAGVDQAQLRRLLPRAVEDPFARELIPDASLPGAPARSPRLAVARGKAAPWAALWRDAAVATLALAGVHGPASGMALPVSLWSHPRAAEDDPVLLLTDGEVWRDQFPVAAELARRVEAGSCRPVHVLFLESINARQRQWDLTASPGGTRSLLVRLRELVPDLRGPWIVAGQSLGGLFAAQCATRHPDLVAAAIAQSPSLWWPATLPGEVRPPGWFEERATARPGAPVLLQGGAYEWNLVDRIRDAAALLQAQGTLLGYTEYLGGHDVLAWQAMLPDALEQVIELAGMRPRWARVEAAGPQ